MAATTVAFPGSSNFFRVDASAKPDLASLAVHLQGATAQLRDAVAAASPLGWDIARGWDIAGPGRCDLHWRGTARPWHMSLSGSMDWGTSAAGISLHPQFLNLPIEQVRAHSEFKPGATHTAISSAQAFGAHWTGTLDHDLSDGWQFAVSGDSVSAVDLDRWLNPRWRESFLDRLLPFLNSRPSLSAMSEPVRARGRLSLDEFALGPATVRHLRGDLALDRRNLALSGLEAQFYGGQLAGSFQAELRATPQYRADLDFSGIDLHAVSAAFPSLANRFAGSASAKIAFNLRGASRAELLGSVECRGTGRADNASITGLHLAQSGRSEPAEPGTTSFHEASASFACASRKIQFDDLHLSSGSSEWDGTGTVGFGHSLDLRLHRVPADLAAPRPAKLAGQTFDEYRLTGTLEEPQISRVAGPESSANEKP